jgi:hypothetical protein
MDFPEEINIKKAALSAAFEALVIMIIKSNRIWTVQSCYLYRFSED